MLRSAHNRYIVCSLLHKTCHNESVSIPTTDIYTVTVASSSEGDPVASGISQCRGRSSGHSDTTGTILDCCHISGRQGNYSKTLKNLIRYEAFLKTTFNCKASCSTRWLCISHRTAVLSSSSYDQTVYVSRS